jgi:hypothetical protein
LPTHCGCTRHHHFCHQLCHLSPTPMPSGCSRTGQHQIPHPLRPSPA